MTPEPASTPPADADPPAEPPAQDDAHPARSADPTAHDAPPPPAAPGPATPSGGPSRDQITLAWADEILVKLRPIVRAVYGAGRFVDGDGGGIAFAVPNEPHRRRCEEHRADVEKAISAHFGTPVRLVLVVDGGSSGAAPTTAGDRPAPPPDEDIDVSELVDAPKESPMTGVERIAAAFPGSQLVDEDD